MLFPGAKVGRYTIARRLGAGGMGEVWRAFDEGLRRWVALKVVRSDEQVLAQRLISEARAAASLAHPNVVRVFDVGEADGHAFVAMDLVEGRTLRELVGAATSEQQVLWLGQIASALAAAHRAGLVHRDVKPENVMIDQHGVAHVLDFGIAKAIGIDPMGPTTDRAMLTGEGKVIGTPAYMAPEQLAGGPPNPSWDQYAFGVLAYELVTGKHPRIDRLVKADGSVTAPASLVPVLPNLSRLIERAMAPTPDRRFASMDEICAELGMPVASPAAPGAARSGDIVSNPRGGDTLETPLYPNAPVQQMPPRRWPFALLAVVPLLAAAAVFAWWKIARKPEGPVVSAPTTATASSAPPVPAPPAPPATSRHSAQATSPAISPVISAKPPSVTPIAPPKKLVAILSGTTGLQYDERAVERVARPLQSAVAACARESPPPKLPALYVVHLELWSIGGEEGKVRSSSVDAPAPLAKCIAPLFADLSFGPPKDARIPPGAVFVRVRIE